ncbi:VOC family protein [Paludibacterium paludis]|uniref:VOC domain-containing protein n=1 Tax=Paludibacterium paludis TaxID=1225769 RepID=A0A918P5A9_9NEIS|nr:VOC family protein [Paludibacterium paludis]GGY22406.1 hypothetical protein GCM10011289_27700 [Paludibacterium paludis]
MNQHIANIALLVDDYDKAIEWFTETLGFSLLEDSDLGRGKRWVRVAPPGRDGTSLLLAKAASPLQDGAIGNQSGGRVFLFLHTDDFQRDHAAFQKRGVKFLEAPREEAYGTVAVFVDLYGNKWDLLQLA